MFNRGADHDGAASGSVGWREELTLGDLADLNLQFDVSVILDVAHDLWSMRTHRLLELLHRIEVQPAYAGEGRWCSRHSTRQALVDLVADQSGAFQPAHD